MGLSSSLTSTPPPATSFPRDTAVQVEVYGTKDWARIAQSWSELHKESPHSSFYLSADWTAAWLEVFGGLLQPQFLLFKAEELTVGACLLVESQERRGPFKVRRIYLNTVGGDPEDRTLMEFNNVLCLAGWEDRVAAALGAHLQNLEWDEFVIEGVLPGPVLTSLQSRCFPDLAAPAVSVMPSYYVDLDELRQRGLAYETLLSPNTREQIRRSVKLYGKVGEIAVDVAVDLRTAEAYFEEMCRLHQSTWLARGESGAFAPGRRLNFHRALIRRAFPNGGIQMVRVSVGDETIGILYNFIERGKVYFFQSGFQYRPEKHLKPGLVTHSCAVRFCLTAGYREYDFLAGDARYKRSLAKTSRPMAWVVFARPRLKLAVIETLRVCKSRARKFGRGLLR